MELTVDLEIEPPPLPTSAALAEHRQREYGIHAELYEPILRRDPEQARTRMREHLEDAKDLIIQGSSEISDKHQSGTTGET